MVSLKKFFSRVFPFLILFEIVHAQENVVEGTDVLENKRGELVKVFTGISYDSSHTFDVLHYRLDLTFPLISSAFSGTVTAICRSNEAGLDEVTFHMVDLVTDSVTSEGERLSASQTAENIVISLGNPVAQGDTFTVSVAYHGSPDERGFYFYEMCAYTFAEPIDARHWFPCYDVPWDKATAELHVTVPEGVEVASIGVLEGREVSGDGAWETFHWRTIYPVATYLISVAMSEHYVRWSDWYISPEGDSTEISYYIFERDSAKARRDFVNMVAAMEFFSDCFGHYPFEKYGMAEVEPCPFGGMEHQTMTTINSSWIQGDRSRESGLVHELAHMWWGDAVTLNDWPAIWLNEGFAVYSEALFQEHYYGWDAFRGYMEYSKSTYISQTDSYDFPIYDPYYLFNYGIIYKKGGWVLHMLRHVVGDDAFWMILKTYYETYKYSNATIPEFQSLCETVSGMDLGWFFQEWIYDMGYPKVEYSWESRFISSDLYEITINLNQFHSVGPRFRMPLDVRFEGFEGTEDTTVWMEKPFESFAFLMDYKPTDVHLDPEGWILMEQEYMAGGIRRSDEIPDRFALFQNFPNPFNESTTIYYNVPDFEGSRWNIRIVVYNILGELVRTLVERWEDPGCYWIQWEGTDDWSRPVSTGVYVVEFSTDGFCQRRKVVLVR